MGNIKTQNRSETKSAKNTRAKDFSTIDCKDEDQTVHGRAYLAGGGREDVLFSGAARRTAWEGARVRVGERVRRRAGGTRAVVVVRGGLDEVLVVRGGGDGRRARGGEAVRPLRGILHVGGGGRRAPSRGGAHRLRRRARSRVRSRCGGIRSSRHPLGRGRETRCDGRRDEPRATDARDATGFRADRDDDHAPRVLQQRRRRRRRPASIRRPPPPRPPGSTASRCCGA